MIRLLLRFGFWALLVTVFLPGLKHADVFSEGVNAATLGRVAQLAYADLANLCTRNPAFCQTAKTATADALEKAKSGMLAAYEGVRTQYDEPDRDTITASIRK